MNISYCILLHSTINLVGAGKKGLVPHFTLTYVLTCRHLHIIMLTYRPVDLLNATPFRLIYCVILTLWGADVFQDSVNPSLYYVAPNNTVLDAAKLFGEDPSLFPPFLSSSLPLPPSLCSPFLYSLPPSIPYHLYPLSD